MLHAFQPISLAYMQQHTALLSRLETKYLTHFSNLETILHAFAASHYILTIGEENVFTYNTVYFDTPDLQYYTEHHNGKRLRKKIRTRLYEETGACFFEVKLKKKRQTIKERYSIDPIEHGIISPCAVDFITTLCSRLYNVLFTDTIQPAIGVKYKRITLTDHDLQERITFDFDFSFTNLFDPKKQILTNKRMLIIESKASRQRSLNQQIMKKLRIPAVDSCSKYCIGVNMFNFPAKKNNFKEVMKKIRNLGA